MVLSVMLAVEIKYSFQRLFIQCAIEVLTEKEFGIGRKG